MLAYVAVVTLRTVSCLCDECLADNVSSDIWRTGIMTAAESPRMPLMTTSVRHPKQHGSADADDCQIDRTEAYVLLVPYSSSRLRIKSRAGRRNESLFADSCADMGVS